MDPRTTPLNIFSFVAQINLPQSVSSFLERVAERPWTALVELLLIGSVVYAVLRFLHGTRGARLLRAVMTILVVGFTVVWVIADKFGLERIGALYRYFIPGVFLVSLVAFQTELRRLLIRLGQGEWLQRWLTNPGAAIDPIVIAVDRLAKKKIGALIAIERSTELGALAETGVRLDAVVSSELLETIFWPGTSLHDLGVIIHQKRILAAGCQFPLSDSAEIDRTLGSRHRAALGMSLELDGVVIVVSEETGMISVARNGHLRRGLTIDQLSQILVDELVVTPKQPDQTADEDKDKVQNQSGEESKADPHDATSVTTAQRARETVRES